MNFFSLGAMAGIVFLGAAVGWGEPRREPAPVLVELFTSEGCSSCPPADKLVAEYATRPPVDGVPVVVLAYHVDYWDGLGWRDPFASKQWTEEQNAAVRALHGDSLYTPQMVVDGQVDLVGSDRTGAKKAIEAASKKPKADVALDVRPADARNVNVTIQISPHGAWPADEQVEVVLVVTEGNLTTSVHRGENAGKQLAHSDVVRISKVVGTFSKDAASPEGRGGPIHANVRSEASWRTDGLRVIAFVRSVNTRHVYGTSVAAWPVSK